MKLITIVGALGKDSELRSNERGEFIAFSVAVNKSYKKDSGVDWFGVSYFNTNLHQHLKKGQKVVVSGELLISEKQSPDGSTRVFHNVKANQIEFAGNKPRQETRTQNNNYTDHDNQQRNDLDDEIPF